MNSLEDKKLEIYIIEYQKECSFQKDVTDRFIKLSFLLNAGIVGTLLWLVNNNGIRFFQIFTNDKYITLYGFLLIINSIIISGLIYQVYSFYNAAYLIFKIKQKLLSYFNEDLIISENDLGRFDHLNVMLAKRSETFPVILWLSLPTSLLLFGLISLFISVLLLEYSFMILMLIFCVIIYSLLTLIYIYGFYLWHKKLNSKVINEQYKEL